jgi:hypothetical protein
VRTLLYNTERKEKSADLTHHSKELLSNEKPPKHVFEELIQDNDVEKS